MYLCANVYHKLLLYWCKLCIRVHGTPAICERPLKLGSVIFSRISSETSRLSFLYWMEVHGSELNFQLSPVGTSSRTVRAPLIRHSHGPPESPEHSFSYPHRVHLFPEMLGAGKQSATETTPRTLTAIQLTPKSHYSLLSCRLCHQF